MTMGNFQIMKNKSKTQYAVWDDEKKAFVWRRSWAQNPFSTQQYWTNTFDTKEEAERWILENTWDKVMPEKASTKVIDLIQN